MTSERPEGVFDRVTSPDESLGVKESPVFDRMIVDSRAWDDSDEPRRELEAISPGDMISIGDVEFDIRSVCRRRNYGQRGVCDVGVPPSAFGTVAKLVVDRDPYLLDICNGPIYTVAPGEVSISD